MKKKVRFEKAQPFGKKSSEKATTQQLSGQKNHLRSKNTRTENTSFVPKNTTFEGVAGGICALTMKTNMNGNITNAICSEKNGWHRYLRRLMSMVWKYMFSPQTLVILPLKLLRQHITIHSNPIIIYGLASVRWNIYWCKYLPHDLFAFCSSFWQVNID